MTASDYEKVLLALTAYREARGDGENACLAVMSVIMNRKRANDHKSVQEIICGQNQFSSISVHSDPETVVYPHPNEPIFLFCLNRADGIYNGTDNDLTHGAQYYYNPSTATSPWFEEHIVHDPVNHPPTVNIGRQSFFK